MIQEQMSVKGRLSVVLLDADGKVKQSQDIPNLVVNSGLAFIASRMKDTTDAAMSHMAVGSGTTAAAAGNTALETQIGSRVSLTSTTVTANATAYVATFAAGTGTGAITEAGIFNASTSGTMLCRTVFSVVNKGADDTLQITWTITLNAA
ncbi:MAG TPA: hypothetical protein VLA40_06350 [Rheinheimera sp.]|nr:hypothetical protein [Rheinheimera sp.]